MLIVLVVLTKVVEANYPWTLSILKRYVRFLVQTVLNVLKLWVESQLSIQILMY